jgi:hypothetical protein
MLGIALIAAVWLTLVALMCRFFAVAARADAEASRQIACSHRRSPVKPRDISSSAAR